MNQGKKYKAAVSSLRRSSDKKTFSYYPLGFFDGVCVFFNFLKFIFILNHAHQFFLDTSFLKRNSVN